MPVKKGGGGKPQEYDPSNGRYGSGSIGTISKTFGPQPQGPKVLTRSLLRKKRLDERAANSEDPLLPDVYNNIQTWVCGCVMKVNEKYYLSPGHNGEIDIETRHLVIEVKSGTARHFVKQFTQEAAYAKIRNKEFIVFAPNMSQTRKNLARKLGFNVVSTDRELKEIIIRKEGK